MNNSQQKITYLECAEISENIDLPAIEKFALTQILIAYTWMSSKDVFIGATHKDIIKLFLDDIKTAFLHSKEEREEISQLLSKLD